MARAAEDQTGSHRLCEAFGLVGDLLLLFVREIDEMIVLGANQEGNRCLVEASALSVPFLDRVERAFSCEVEHEENSDGIVADKGQHVDELALPAEIPDRERNLGVSDGDGLFHEVDALPCQCRERVTGPLALPSVWM